MDALSCLSPRGMITNNGSHQCFYRVEQVNPGYPQCLDKALNSSQPCGNRASVANFHGAYSLSWSFREAVDRNFPELSIDWTAVADDLAQGPSEDPPLSTTEWDWARMEHHR